MRNSSVSFSLQDGTKVKVVHASKTAYSFTFFSPNGEQKEIVYHQSGRAKIVVKTGEPLQPFEHEALQAFWRYQD
jgi:hypothetical protein